MHVNDTGKTGNLISLPKLSESIKPISTGKKHVNVKGEFKQLLPKIQVYFTEKLWVNCTEKLRVNCTENI